MPDWTGPPSFIMFWLSSHTVFMTADCRF